MKTNAYVLISQVSAISHKFTLRFTVSTATESIHNTQLDAQQREYYYVISDAQFSAQCKKH